MRKRPKRARKSNSKNDRLKSFCSWLKKKVKNHFITSMFVAFIMKLLCDILFQAKGVGWVINLISDVYLVTNLAFVYAFFLKENLKRLF